MKEVEILVEILEDKESVLKKLEQFNFVGVKKVLDVYFTDSKREELKPDEKGRLNNCFRLRKTRLDSSRQEDDKNYLAFKKDHFENDIWSHSDEYETEVEDFETTMEIIRHLGFEVLIEIENEKHTFLTDKPRTLFSKLFNRPATENQEVRGKYEIVFEDVKNLGLFLEVERLKVGDDENIEEIKKEIWKFIKNLNIKTSKELNAGKPELMLNKNKYAN